MACCRSAADMSVSTNPELRQRSSADQKGENGSVATTADPDVMQLEKRVGLISGSAMIVGTMIGEQLKHPEEVVPHYRRRSFWSLSPKCYLYAHLNLSPWFPSVLSLPTSSHSFQSTLYLVPPPPASHPVASGIPFPQDFQPVLYLPLLISSALLYPVSLPSRLQ